MADGREQVTMDEEGNGDEAEKEGNDDEILGSFNEVEVKTFVASSTEHSEDITKSEHRLPDESRGCGEFFEEDSLEDIEEDGEICYHKEEVIVHTAILLNPGKDESDHLEQEDEVETANNVFGVREGTDSEEGGEFFEEDSLEDIEGEGEAFDGKEVLEHSAKSMNHEQNEGDFSKPDEEVETAHNVSQTVEVTDPGGSGELFEEDSLEDMEEEREVSDDEEEKEMGLTIRGWSDVGETVVLASDFTGSVGSALKDTGDVAESGSGDDDNFEEDDGEDFDDNEEGMFNDDVDNLYDAYKSVLAADDDDDLDPLDTSVVEDPYADLPPICEEDDELGTGDLTESIGKVSSGFEDSNAQTILPAFIRKKDDISTCSNFRTDDFNESLDGANVQEFEISEFQAEDMERDEPLEESGGVVVTEGKVEQVMTGEAFNDSDNFGVEMLGTDELIEEASSFLHEEESLCDEHIPGFSDGLETSREESVVAMEETQECENMAQDYTGDAETLTELVAIEQNVPSEFSDLTVVGELAGKTHKDNDTGCHEQSTETEREMVIEAEETTQVFDEVDRGDLCEERNDATENSSESPSSTTQDPKVEETHVEQATATIQDDSVFTNGTSEHDVSSSQEDADVSCSQPESGPCLFVEDTGSSLQAEGKEESEQGQIESREETWEVGGQTEFDASLPSDDLMSEQTPLREIQDETQEAIREESPTTLQAETNLDLQAEDHIDVSVAAKSDKPTDLQLNLHYTTETTVVTETKYETTVVTDTKYDSGCESERSLRTVSSRSTKVTEYDEDCPVVGEDSELVDGGQPSKEYPAFINICEEKLKVHYVSCYAKEAPIDWFHVPNKPTHRIFTNTNLVERNGRLHEKLLTFDNIDFKSGLRILIEGRAGMGKSTLIHRIAYDYGLGILPALTRFKLVFVLDVLKWSRDQELHDVLLEQAVQADTWGIDPNNLFGWMENNPEDVIFLIDGLDEHPGFPAHHSLLNLAQGELYSNSTVVFTTQPNRVFEIADCCHKIYVMQKFTEKQVNEFVANFLEGIDTEEGDLKKSLFHDKSLLDFYRVPLNLALLCTLFLNKEIVLNDPLPSSLTELFNRVFVYTLRQLVADRRVDSQKDLELSMYEDMAFVLTRLSLSCLQDDTVTLSKSHLASEHDIDDDLLDEFIQYGLLEKIVGRDAYFFPYKLYQEFLAAKFIAIEYFSAANSGQIGVAQDMKHVNELFELCWACYADGYKYEDLCIFVSSLLTRDSNHFVDALCKQYKHAPDSTAREMCLNVACACISENAKNRGFISQIVDCLASKGDLSLDFAKDNADGPYLLGISHMLAADKLPKFSLVNYDPHDTDALRSLASAIEITNRLGSLEIDFTNLDPTINNTRKMSDGAEDFSLLKHFVKSLSVNTSIKNLGLRFNVDVMSLHGVEIISGLFLNSLGDLKSLGVHIHFNQKSTYFKNFPLMKENIHSYENLNIFISRFAVFLENNTMLEKLELNGCFLHKDALPELKTKIIDHDSLRSLSIAGQKEGAPLHREGANALAEILMWKNFDEVSLDLNSFLTRQTQKYNLKDRQLKFDNVLFENELIIAKLLKAMQGNGKLRRVKFTCQQIDCDLLDHVSDFVEECISLTHLEIACEEMDDLFTLFLGCGVLCSGTLENLVLHGKFDSGGATYHLIQSCVMSFSLKSTTLSGTFTQDCIDWLAMSLPTLSIHCVHPMTLVLQGHVGPGEGESDSVLESIEQLNNCVLPLDLLLETDFK